MSMKKETVEKNGIRQGINKKIEHIEIMTHGGGYDEIIGISIKLSNGKTIHIKPTTVNYDQFSHDHVLDVTYG